MNRRNSDAWYYLGRAYYSQTRVPDAKNAFLTVLKLEPYHPKAENNLGLIFESEAKPDEALVAYRNAISWQEHSPTPSEQPYLNLGSLLLQQGSASDALPPLEKAVQIAPGNALCHLKLGSALSTVGQVERSTAGIGSSGAIGARECSRTFSTRAAIQTAQVDGPREEGIRPRRRNPEPRGPAAIGAEATMIGWFVESSAKAAE